MSRDEFSDWVEKSSDGRNREFRQAVHTVLRAIASIPGATEWIALKGAVLLSLRYGVTRTTKDVDFSTERHYNTFDTETFLGEFGDAMVRAVDDLPYGLACRVQSWKVQPSHPDANYQTLEVGVGYAPSLNSSRMRKLLGAGGSPSRVAVEISFNERLYSIEMLGEGSVEAIPAYSLTEFVGEKLRAILQQPVRNRFRRQDALDIFLLLKLNDLHEPATQARVFDILRAKSDARGLAVSKLSMRDPEVRRRSARDYQTLADDIDFDLPGFDTVFQVVSEYYESLPWDAAKS